MFGPDLFPTNARLFIAAACVLLALSGVVWVLFGGEEATGQSQPTTASPAPASPSAASPDAASPSPDLNDFGSFPDGASASPFAGEEEEPEGIPGLGAVSLISNLDELTPGERWPCDGPSPGDGSRLAWTCADPSGSYGVEVVGEGPLTVLSVEAVARGVPDGEAEEFFGYVLRLSLEEGPSALDPESWAAGAVPSGGTIFAGETEITVYGDGRTRAMTVTSTADFLD